MQRADLERMSTGDLKRIASTAWEIIADRKGELIENRSREVVERRRGKGGRWLQWEMVKCGKPHCSKDRDGAGHGPYWYLYYTNERTGKYTIKYIGKKLTPELMEEFREPEATPAG